MRAILRTERHLIRHPVEFECAAREASAEAATSIIHDEFKRRQPGEPMDDLTIICLRR